MRITINRLTLNWPKPTITEDQLRMYANADDLNDIWQANHLGGATLINGVANVYDGAQFYSTPRKTAA